MYDKGMKAEDALAIALANSGGHEPGPGDGDMKMSVYDDTEEVKDAGGIKNFVEDEISGAINELGDLASKDSVSATYTPAGSVEVSQGNDSHTLINVIAQQGMLPSVGTLPSFEVNGEDMTFNPGTLPQVREISVVSEVGTRSATFTGTEATITAQ